LKVYPVFEGFPVSEILKFRAVQKWVNPGIGEKGKKLILRKRFHSLKLVFPQDHF